MALCKDEREEKSLVAEKNHEGHSCPEIGGALGGRTDPEANVTQWFL